MRSCQALGLRDSKQKGRKHEGLWLFWRVEAEGERGDQHQLVCLEVNNFGIDRFCNSR